MNPTEQEEFEFRLRMEREAATAPQSAVATAPQPAGPTSGEMLASHPLTRFAMGAASPLIAAAQGGAHVGDVINRATGAEPVVSPWIDQQIQAYEQAKQRGMEARGTPGFDWYGLAGNLAPAGKIASATAKALPEATSLLGRMGIGAAQGGAVAAATPVTQGDYGTQKAAQVGTGATIGAAIPAVQSVASALYNFGKGVVEPFTESGRAAMLKRYQEHLLAGDLTTKDKVVQALMNAKELVPGSKPTAGQVLADIPEATGLASHQARIAKNEGISPLFTARAAQQEAARQGALASRDAALGPARTAALAQANAGGVQAAPIMDRITAIETEPGTRASDVVQKTMGAVKEKLASLTNEQGQIDARDLYTVRKEIGNTIRGFAKETANWDKKMTGGLERDIQKSMDDAIEAAGATGWKDYLKEFATRSKAISEDEARQEAYRRLAMKTNFSGAKAIHEGTQFPNLLSRPAMVANYLIRTLGSEPANEKIVKLAASQYLNPEQLAMSLRGPVPSRYQPMIDALLKQAQQQAPGMAALPAARNY